MAHDPDLDRILVTFGMDDDRAAIWLTRFIRGSDLVNRSIDLGDVVAHTLNIFAVHDGGADLAHANQDRAALAVALRDAADRIAASVVLVPSLPLEAPPLELVTGTDDGMKAEKVQPFCRWTEDDEGTWWTDCKEGFCLDDGPPSKNRIRFCCYCGKPLKEQPHEADR